MLAERDTADSIRQALRWTPGRAQYHFRLAFLTGDREELERAAALNPSDAATWIALGLRSERAGAMQAAERELLRAAELDQQYLPRWTLANFYYRQNRSDQFWSWATAAAERVPGDPTPLFRLCGQFGEDGGLIDRLRIGRPEVRLQYLLYLMQINRMDLALPAVHKVLDSRRDRDVPTTLVACDRLLAEKHPQDAVAIWNRLASEHRIPFGLAGPMVNGDFAVMPTSHGFDWRLPAQPGVTAAIERNPQALRLSFSGDQPEVCDLLWQFVPVRENTSYTLRFVYRTTDLPPDPGLHWRAWNGETGARLTEGPNLANDQAAGNLTFRTPAGCRLVRVSLEYVRTPGTTRITGDLLLRTVTLAP